MSAASRPAAAEHVPELVAKMARGDASAWPRWAPGFLSAGDVMDAFGRALSRRGAPGAPRTVHVYTHFSLCESSCRFCMYYHRVPQGGGDYAAHADHLVGLLARVRQRIGRARISNAYMGGGTPTAFGSHLDRFLAAFRDVFDVRGEHTVEGHPATMDVAMVRMLARHGVSRLSMGLQSLDPAVLATIGRKNPSLSHVASLIGAAHGAGIHVNVDLCYGLPDQTEASFRHDTLRAAGLGADLVTLYRYQPVARLPAPAGTFHVRRALGPAVRINLLRRGIVAMLPRDAERPGGRLIRPTPRLMRRFGQLFSPLRRGLLAGDAESAKYACFDAGPSHLLGLGPGAYTHLFGFAWLREVTDVREGNDAPVFLGTRLSPADEARQLVLRTLSRGRPVDRARLTRIAGVDPVVALGAPLSGLMRDGAVELRRGRLRLRPGLKAATRTAALTALVPTRPPPDPVAVLDAPQKQRSVRELLRPEDVDAQDGPPDSPRAEHGL